MRQGALMLVVLLAAACSRSIPVPSSQTADSAALGDLRAREAAAAKQGDLDGVMATLSADVVIMPPNATPIVGAGPVRDWLGPVLAQYDYDVRYTSKDLVISGDWAIDRGDYELALTPRAGGAPTLESGKYLWAIRREADGQWRYWRSIWSSNAPPPAQ